MGATIDALFRLQTIESQLRSVRGQIESKSRRVVGQARRISVLEQQISETHHASMKAQAEVNAFDLERKTQEAHIGRLREGLNQAKSNKDYAAILTQLNTDKADMLKLEDKVLAAMGKVDDLKKKTDDLKAGLDKEQVRLAELKKDVSDQEARLADELKGLELQRAQAAEVVGPENLQMFDRACGRHEGEAMGRVGRVHPKREEYICTGCHMSVPLERVNSLQTRDEVQLCPNCQRILCLDVPAAVRV